MSNNRIDEKWLILYNNANQIRATGLNNSRLTYGPYQDLIGIIPQVIVLISIKRGDYLPNIHQ